jgi:predicted nuclease of restriction endonuclease-like (RecB) superfamily
VDTYARIRSILEQARTAVARTVNSAQVVANWLVGREIVEGQQKGLKKAGYAEALLEQLANRLSAEFGSGYSATNLRWFRQFFLEYPSLLAAGIHHAVRDELRPKRGSKIRHAVRGESQSTTVIDTEKSHAVGGKSSWKPGMLHTGLSWTHYRTLLRVEMPQARAFYEVESTRNNWSARELERQINSLLFERLAKSRDKKGLMRLATRGHEIVWAADIFKDPVVMEFLGIPESPRLVESELEQALIDNLRLFLLELGKGFAFIERQQRLTLEGDHFYVDLVFYHTILKCFVLVDLKVQKLTHADLGQMQLYVNYYDQHKRSADDNPTLGLILCTDKNDAMVKYMLGKANRRIFASRYKLHLPSEAELAAEIRRELSEVKRFLPKKNA